jgi:hypothetical protein
MPEWQPMGGAKYNYLLKHVLLLPFDAHDLAHLGEVELARYLFSGLHLQTSA